MLTHPGIKMTQRSSGKVTTSCSASKKPSYFSISCVSMQQNKCRMIHDIPDYHIHRNNVKIKQNIYILQLSIIR